MIARIAILVLWVPFCLFHCQVPDTENTPAQEAAPKTDFRDFSDFWKTFQVAVVQEEAETVAGMTFFPLGSRGFFELSKADKAIFLQKYKDLFDAHAKAKIKATKAEEVSSYQIGPEESRADIYKNAGIDASMKIYRLSVLYTYQEGEEPETESSVSYHFAPVKGFYRLFLVEIAG